MGQSAKLQRSERLNGIELSLIVQISESVARERAAGRDVVSFGTGEPDFPTPPAVIEAAHQAALDGQTRYPATAGIAPLRAVVAEQARTTPDRVIISTGAKQVIANALLATLNAGDDVLIPAPYWTTYSDVVRFAGGIANVVSCPMAQGFKLTPEQLETALTPRTRWVMLNSPSNPTGAVYTAQEMRAFAEVLECHPHVWIMSDEIYDRITFAPFTSFPEAAPEIADRTLVVNGVSKTYAMTGWRLGWGTGPADLIRAMTVVQGQMTSGASSISQAAALAALSGDQQEIARRAGAFQDRRDLVVNALNATLLDCPEPQGAFYVFPSCARAIGKSTPKGEVISDDVALCRYMLDAQGVAVVPGLAFGMRDHFRLSFAYSEADLRKGMTRITDALAALT